MRRRNSVKHGMQGVFVFLLLALFAMMSVLLVLFGAQMYRGIAERMEQNNDDRVLFSYVRSMVRAEDSYDAVRVEDHGGMKTLGLYENIDGTDYVTWIYEYEGKLLEQFTRADSAMMPDHGVEIMDITEFQPSMDGNLLTVAMFDPEGRDVTVSTALRCGSAAVPVEPEEA